MNTSAQSVVNLSQRIIIIVKKNVSTVVNGVNEDYRVNQTIDYIMAPRNIGESQIGKSPFKEKEDI